MSKLMVGLSALALVVAPASAQMPSGDQEDTTKNVGEKLICKKEETIGSRLAAKKVCLTAMEWKVLAAENREKTEDIQKDAGVRSSN